MDVEVEAEVAVGVEVEVEAEAMAEAGDFRQGNEVAGQVIDSLGGFEVGPADGLGEFKISRAGADESGHVTAAAEDLAEVVAVGADIEALGAVVAEADDGQGDFEDFVFVDADLAGGSVDGFALPGQFVEGNPVFFDGGNHGRNLVELAGEFGEGGLDGRSIQSGNGFGFEDFAGGVLGIGGFAEFEGPLVLFVLGHEQILNPGSFANDEHEESGGNRVERAAVADLALVEAASDKVDDIVGSFAGGFVDQEEAVELGDHLLS